jgi:iron complex outermembrane receptor protein
MRCRTVRHSRFLLLAASALGVTASAAVAQPTPPKADTSAEVPSGEIIVTATRRAERLQDVPLSIQAITGEALEARQISSFTDLQRVSPGLVFNQASSPRSSGTIIRGIGTNTFSDAVEGAVGINIDGVVIGRQGAGFTDFADIERIEVLRGPQGITFGKNASAGVISVITKRPTDTLSGSAFASYGSDNEIKANASLSGPLVGQTVLARMSGFISKRDGIIQNLNDGRDLNDVDDWGVRGKIELRASGDLNVLLSGDWSQRQPDCCTWATRSYGSNAVLKAAEQAVGIVPGPGNRETTLGGRQFTGQKSRGASAEINWTPGDYTLTSITAYRRWDAIDNNDADRTPLPILDINQGDVDQHQFTQEVRLASPANQRLEYVLGLFYFNQEIVNNSIQQGTFGAPLPPGLLISRRQFTEVDTENYAAFGQGSFDIVNGLKVLLGARYTHEKIGIDFKRDNLPGTLVLTPAYTCTRAAPATCGPGGPQPGVPEASDNAWSWRAGLQYQPTRDLNLFATVTRGYKGQAFNSQIESRSSNSCAQKFRPATRPGLNLR